MYKCLCLSGFHLGFSSRGANATIAKWRGRFDPRSSPDISSIMSLGSCVHVLQFRMYFFCAVIHVEYDLCIFQGVSCSVGRGWEEGSWQPNSPSRLWCCPHQCWLTTPARCARVPECKLLETCGVGQCSILGELRLVYNITLSNVCCTCIVAPSCWHLSQC